MGTTSFHANYTIHTRNYAMLEFVFIPNLMCMMEHIVDDALFLWYS